MVPLFPGPAYAPDPKKMKETTRDEGGLRAALDIHLRVRVRAEPWLASTGKGEYLTSGRGEGKGRLSRTVIAASTRGGRALKRPARTRWDPGRAPPEALPSGLRPPRTGLAPRPPSTRPRPHDRLLVDDVDARARALDIYILLI